MDSNYQQAIYKHFNIRGGNAAVIGVAGCGKTYTAINGLKLTNRMFPVLLAAFNKDIQIEFANRVKENKLWHVSPKTFNAVGWASCLRNVPGVELSKTKTRDIFECSIFNAQTDEDRKLRNSWTYLICRIIGLMKNTCIVDPTDQVEDLCDHYGLTLPEDPRFEQMLIDTFTVSNSTKHIMDFDDQKFMPWFHNWSLPKYRTLVVDEFQDVSNLELALIEMSTLHDSQTYVFGDPDQSIYGFKGASPDSFKKFIEGYGATELPLSICYRCPVNVVKRAQKIVPRIEWAPGAKEGVVDTVSYDYFATNVKPKDFVLCRTTEPLVNECLRLISQGVEAKVRGRDLGDQLLGLVKPGQSTQYFIEEITAWKIKKIEELTIARKENEIINITDRVDSLCAVARGTKTTDEIRKRIQDIFTDEVHKGVDFMSIHKSKGLQANRVWILRSDLLPHPSATKQWMREEEARLEYVAITRSSDTLFFVRKPQR